MKGDDGVLIISGLSLLNSNRKIKVINQLKELIPLAKDNVRFTRKVNYQPQNLNSRRKIKDIIINQFKPLPILVEQHKALNIGARWKNQCRIKFEVRNYLNVKVSKISYFVIIIKGSYSYYYYPCHHCVGGQLAANGHCVNCQVFWGK